MGRIGPGPTSTFYAEIPFAGPGAIEAASTEMKRLPAVAPPACTGRVRPRGSIRCLLGAGDAQDHAHPAGETTRRSSTSEPARLRKRLATAARAREPAVPL